MAETVAFLADEVLPERPPRQWALSLPIALRFLRATDPDALTLVLGTAYRTISSDLLEMAGVTRARWFTPEFAIRSPEVIERRMKQVIDTNPDVFLSVFDICAETEMAPWLREIRHPCLVLTGEQDGGCNARLNREIASALPGAELLILPHLRHAILLEAPEVVAPPVLAFLGRQPRR